MPIPGGKGRGASMLQIRIYDAQTHAREEI